MDLSLRMGIRTVVEAIANIRVYIGASGYGHSRDVDRR
jgi:hypothetical protein